MLNLFRRNKPHYREVIGHVSDVSDGMTRVIDDKGGIYLWLGDPKPKEFYKRPDGIEVHDRVKMRFRDGEDLTCRGYFDYETYILSQSPQIEKLAA